MTFASTKSDTFQKDLHRNLGVKPRLEIGVCNAMNWRREEFSDFGDRIDWLSEPDAADVYRIGMSFMSQERYGLDSAKVNGIEKLNVDEDSPGHSAWLASRLVRGDAILLVSYEPKEACRVRADFFVEHWRDLFNPSSDDVIMLPELGEWILYYCHEDEFEFGHRPKASGVHTGVSVDR
jgi:hypothetical protein